MGTTDRAAAARRGSAIIRRSNICGQAQVEYILLIGLVIIFILIMLFNFRDSLNGFIGRVSAWIDGQDAPQPPPPPPPPAPAPP